MRYATWAPYYRRIAADFGFSLASEEAASFELKGLLGPEAREAPGERITARLAGRVAVVVGLAPGVGAPPLARLPPGGRPPAVIAADGATDRCLKAGIVPELIVTDLDGPVPAEITANARGSLAVIHAHGDNRPALREWVPQFPGAVAASWAGPPREGLVNFGGFTDGDRAAYLAEGAGSTEVLLFGFDLEHVDESEPGAAARKRRKLAWAGHLLGVLAGSTGVPISWWRPDGSRAPVLPVPEPTPGPGARAATGPP